MCWLFPGKTITIEAPCLADGQPMTVEMRDGELLSYSPDTLVGYTSAEVGGDAATRPFR